MRTYAGLAIALALFGPAIGPAAAGSWTNAAGHAIAADLIEVKGQVAVFRLADDARLELPLASLAPADRQRALREKGSLVVPDGVRPEYDLCVRTLQRLAQLRDAARLNPEQYAAQRETALAQFRSACARQGIPEADGSRLLLAAGGT